MSGRIFPRATALLTGNILSVVAGALHRKTAELAITAQDLAELAGKSDRKSGQAYLAGESDMGVAGFVRLLSAVADAQSPADAAALASDVLRPLTGLRVIPVVDEASIDMDSAQLGLAALNLEIVKAWRDRKLTHAEILKLADASRPLLPLLGALMAEADRIRGQ